MFYQMSVTELGVIVWFRSRNLNGINVLGGKNDMLLKFKHYRSMCSLDWGSGHINRPHHTLFY